MRDAGRSLSFEMDLVILLWLPSFPTSPTNLVNKNWESSQSRSEHRYYLVDLGVGILSLIHFQKISSPFELPFWEMCKSVTAKIPFRSKLVFENKNPRIRLGIRRRILEYLVEPFQNNDGAVELLMLWVQPELRKCHPFRSGYEMVIPFELNKSVDSAPPSGANGNQTTLIKRHNYDTLLGLSQVNSYIRKVMIF